MQAIEELSIINGNGRLSCQRFEKSLPLSSDVIQWGAVEDLQHTLDLSFGDERNGVIADKILSGQQWQPHKTAFLCKVRDMKKPMFQGCLSGKSFAQTQMGMGDARRAEALPGGVIQALQERVEQQHVGGIHFQLHENLIEHDAQRDAQVETGTDGHVYLAQGGETLHLFLGLLMQRGAVERADGLITNTAGQVEFFRSERLARRIARLAQHQKSEGMFVDMERDDAQGLGDAEEKGRTIARFRAAGLNYQRGIFVQNALASGMVCQRLALPHLQSVVEHADGKSCPRDEIILLQEQNAGKGDMCALDCAAGYPIEDGVEILHL